MFTYIFCDIDGVLTNGGYIYDHNGNISKSFHTRDIHCIKRLIQIGFKVNLITGASDKCTIERADSANIPIIYNCSNKLDYINSYYINNYLCTWDEILYIGDGVNDLPCMDRSKYVACPKDASPYVKELEGICISDFCGGSGCVEDILYKYSKALKFNIYD